MSCTKTGVNPLYDTVTVDMKIAILCLVLQCIKAAVTLLSFANNWQSASQMSWQRTAICLTCSS
jgi:hypothetical protein